MNSYLFYDLETTGLNKAFDQVLQFAAIRTDTLFKEKERYTIQVRLRPDVIVSPHAIIVNRIPITDSMKGKREYDAVVQIHRLMNEPGTTSLGYNTLGFDDEFLRFSFYRNLLPPYTHQYDKACHRMDLLPITTVFRLYNEKVLNWPISNGEPTLRLEHLNAANQFSEGAAHDAIVDVTATVELARRLSREEDMWNYLVGSFNKETDRLRIAKFPVALSSPLGIHQKGIMIGSEYGPGLHYQVPVIYIGDSIPYSNQTLWLRIDLPELRDTTVNTIADTTWVVRKRLGEPDIILPPHDRYWRLLEERQAIVEENLKWLQLHPELFQEIITYHQEYSYPVIPDVDVDAALYQFGFFSNQEQKLSRVFHVASPDNKMKQISQFPTDVTRELAGRIVCRNFPENMDKRVKREFKKYMQRINTKNEEDALLDYRGEKRRTPFRALSQINDLKHDSRLDREQLALLDDLEKYINQTFLNINGKIL